MECERCGREIPEDSQFCASCGAEVPPAEQSTVPPPTQVPAPPAPVPPPAPAIPPATAAAPPSAPSAFSAASLMDVRQAPPPSADPAPGADPASGALVLNFACFMAAFRLLLTDPGNFIGLGVALQVGIGVAMAITIVLTILLGLAVKAVGVLIGAALMVILVPAIPFSQYAILVKKLRTGTFDWSMWGRGLSRYFAILGRMIGLQVVTLAPMIVWFLIAGGSLISLLAMARAVHSGGAPSAPGLGFFILAPLGLVFLLVQLWWAARLFFSSGLIILQNKSLGEAVGQSLASTNRMQWQVLVYLLAIAGIAFGVQIVVGVLGQIPVIGYIIGLAGVVIGGVLGLWQWLVMWMVFRDNYGLAEAMGLEE